MISIEYIIPTPGSEYCFSKLSVVIRGIETSYLDYAGQGSDPNRAKTRMIWKCTKIQKEKWELYVQVIVHRNKLICNKTNQMH